MENKNFPIEEVAIRFHHKLVWIHPFLNGNGRFSRLAADLLLFYNGHPKFTWGSQNLTSASVARDTYLKALRRVDKNNEEIEDLLKFSKS
jgi:Fic family protein